MSKPMFLIVGASLTGAKAAEELRSNGFDGRVMLVGAEPERPYERPPLTKDYLRGESGRAKAYVHPDGFYEEQEIELVTGVTVTAIDPGASRVTLHVWDVNPQIEALIRAQQPAEAAALADPRVTLDSLAGELAAGS